MQKGKTEHTYLFDEYGAAHPPIPYSRDTEDASYLAINGLKDGIHRIRSLYSNTAQKILFFGSHRQLTNQNIDAIRRIEELLEGAVARVKKRSNTQGSQPSTLGQQSFAGNSGLQPHQ